MSGWTKPVVLQRADRLKGPNCDTCVQSFDWRADQFPDFGRPGSPTSL